MKITFRQSVRNHIGALFFTEVQQLPTAFSVCLQYGNPRPTRQGASKQYSLRRKILIHSLMKVEMVTGQIREYCHIKSDAERSLLHQRMRRHLHRNFARPIFNCIAKQSLQFEWLWCRMWRG